MFSPFNNQGLFNLVPGASSPSSHPKGRNAKNHSQPGNFEVVKQMQLTIALVAGTIPIYIAPLAYVRDIAASATLIRPIAAFAHRAMLHLALSGNILCAMGITPVLYSPDYVLNSPAQIFNVILAQLPGGSEFVGLTNEVMKPVNDVASGLFGLVTQQAKPLTNLLPGGGIIPDIGNANALVELLFTGLEQLIRSNPSAIRQDKTATQITAADGLWPKGQGDLIIVKDVQTALAALKIVVTGFNPQQFCNLLRSIDPKTFQPVVLNPKTENYKGKKFYEVSLACDAAYCFLLISLQRLWEAKNFQTREELVDRNIQPLMKTILPPLGAFLVTEHMGNLVAAPCYNFYKFDEDPLEELKAVMQAAVEKYADTPFRQNMLQDIAVIIDECIPVDL